MADHDEDRPYASPPCYMHEVDPAYMGLPGPAKGKEAWKTVGGIEPPHANHSGTRRENRGRQAASSGENRVPGPPSNRCLDY